MGKSKPDRVLTGDSRRKRYLASVWVLTLSGITLAISSAANHIESVDPNRPQSGNASAEAARMAAECEVDADPQLATQVADRVKQQCQELGTRAGR